MAAVGALALWGGLALASGYKFVQVAKKLFFVGEDAANVEAAKDSADLAKKAMEITTAILTPPSSPVKSTVDPALPTPPPSPPTPALSLSPVSKKTQ
jgi:hypothetical protein